MNDISKEELLDILKDSLYYCVKITSDSYSYQVEYDILSDDDISEITDDVYSKIEKLLQKKRNIKIKKIKEKLKKERRIL